MPQNGNGGAFDIVWCDKFSSRQSRQTLAHALQCQGCSRTRAKVGGINGRILSHEHQIECTERFVARHYDDYWLKTETRRIADHARLMQRAERDEAKLATDYASNAFTAITELTVLAPNHPRLLALFAGACAVAVGGELIDPQTIKDGKYETFTERARQYLEVVRKTRAEMAA